MEAKVLSNLAEWFSESAQPLVAIESELWDLLTAVRTNEYHPEFGGSFSLKDVAPALAGHEYADLAIADRLPAGLAFLRLGSHRSRTPRPVAFGIRRNGSGVSDRSVRTNSCTDLCQLRSSWIAVPLMSAMRDHR